MMDGVKRKRAQRANNSIQINNSQNRNSLMNTETQSIKGSDAGMDEQFR